MSFATGDTLKPLTFQAPKSFVNPSFWEELYRKKLDEYKLGEEEKLISGSFLPSDNGTPHSSPNVSVEASSFLTRGDSASGSSSSSVRFSVHGKLINVNTPTEFKSFDKKGFLNAAGERIWSSVTSGEFLRRPQLLNSFVLLTYADLKSYRFTYWFGFPAIVPPSALSYPTSSPPRPIRDLLTVQDTIGMYKGIVALISASKADQEPPVDGTPSVFGLVREECMEEVLEEEEGEEDILRGALESPKEPPRKDVEERPITTTTDSSWVVDEIDSSSSPALPPLPSHPSSYSSSPSEEIVGLRKVMRRGFRHRLVTLEQAWQRKREGGRVTIVSIDTSAAAITQPSMPSHHQATSLSKPASSGSLTQGTESPRGESSEKMAWREQSHSIDSSSSSATTTTTATKAAEKTLCLGWEQRNVLAALSAVHAADHLRDRRGMNGQSEFGDVDRLDVILLRGSALKRALLSKWARDSRQNRDGDKDRDALDLDEEDEDQILLSGDSSIVVSLDLSNDHFSILNQLGSNPPSPQIIGWETNERGRPGPRVADLSGTMDSGRVMQQAVDLNLKLMRWRMWPTLDTDKLAATKCLLLGAGTLGCAVARCLLGWGIRHITFVDNGRVSFSNPSRQCLYEFSDCEKRSHKAIAAADRLRAIFPGVSSTGHVLSIPMPGHPMGEGDEDSVRILDGLISEHDVIFLLTDSREARWLPTVASSAREKLLINTALGFDSYLVMRHGHTLSTEDCQTTHCLTAPQQYRLGCYFCSDVVAPGNSMRDRTLDQQCTVTRPGLAFIAAGLAVEMMVALLHSPFRERHPALETTMSEAPEDSVVIIPHQIRGNLASFTQVLPASPSFPHCTACSPAVVGAYREDRQSRSVKGFVHRVCEMDGPSHLEELSGIAELSRRMQDVDIDFNEEEDQDV